MRLSERKIHISAVFIQIFFYISLSLFLYAYIETHGENLEKINPDHWANMMTLATASTFGLIITVTLMIGVGIYYFVKINDASQRYRTLNMVNGALILVGGLGISLIISLYLMFNE